MLKITRRELLAAATAMFLCRPRALGEVADSDDDDGPPPPGFTAYGPRQRNPGRIMGSTILADVESHLPAGNIYRDSDPTTWCHEGTHGVNSYIRNQYGTGTGAINAFYVLNNKAVVVYEPRGLTLSTVARMVPPTCKGRIFDLYLRQQLRDWNEVPTYVLDEWTAYTNGAACSLELRRRNSDVDFMLEMGIYSLALGAAVDTYVQQNRIRYDQAQLRAYLAYGWERVMLIWQQAADAGGLWMFDPAGWYDRLRLGSDQYTTAMRAWAKRYFGEKWTGRVLRF